MNVNTDNTNYIRDLSSNAILANNKKMLEQHRKQINEKTEINKLKGDVQELKTKINLILNILTNKG